MLVKNLMKPFLKLNCRITITKAAQAMEEAHTGSALVEKNGKLIGVVTERDFLRKVVANGHNPLIETIDAIMTAPIISISPNADVYEASELMSSRNIRRLAVTNEKGEILGKITAHSISKNIKYITGKQMLDARTREEHLFD
ncbi:MAG: signal transduction protein [Candidatus Diapherotrites archaeon CG08_land_8_20_14_0_20_34_12]|nr:MAG: signal transduction protein [Candidatus Diapherotrites archaeon CG08_land_8_20_14_0_20_34_12]